MTRTTNQRQRGFTLSETLAALAVAGIGIGLAVPGLQSLARSNNQAVAVNKLIATMHLARSTAITRNTRVSVCTSADGEYCGDEPWAAGWIAFVDTDADQDRGADEPLIEQVGPPGLELRSVEFPHAFSYAASGRPEGADPGAAGGEFAVCPQGAATAPRVVIVRANGLPTLTEQGRSGTRLGCPGRVEG